MTTPLATDEALDEIFDAVDSALTAGRFADVDHAIALVDVAETSTDELGAWLSITAAASHKLPSRAAFFKRVVDIANKRGENKPGLFDGLESQ